MRQADIPSAESSPPKPKRGRPPSQAARQAVLSAAYRIVMEEGIGRLTIERVAAEAGVGKPTIYRTWTNAQELAMAAFMAQPQAESTIRRHSSVRHALRAHLGSVVEAFGTRRGRQITLTMASADPDSELAKAFRNQVILKSREAGRQLIDAAIATGEVRPATKVEVVLDMLYGPLFFRMLVGHQALSPSIAGELVDAILDGIASPER